MAGVLRDKVAVITGSGAGIGRALALAMTREGAKVVVNDFFPERAETTTKDITDAGGRAVAFCGDISKFEVARQLIQTAVDNFGRIDILINNAGVSTHSMIWEMPEEDWDRVLDGHLKGTFNCTRHASPFMKEQGWGRILNVTTFLWGLRGWGCCHYAAAKAGIVGFSCAVANDLKAYGVTCNTYRPFAGTRGVMSPEKRDAMWKGAFEAGIITEEQANDLLGEQPAPEEIPPLLIYLCTDEAANITGKVFDIRGGDIAIFSEPAKKNAIHKDYKKKGLWTIAELRDAVPKMLKG